VYIIQTNERPDVKRLKISVYGFFFNVFSQSIPVTAEKKTEYSIPTLVADKHYVYITMKISHNTKVLSIPT